MNTHDDSRKAEHLDWQKTFFEMLHQHDERQRWRQRAACTGRSDLAWFSTLPADEAAAVAVCDTCPVLVECRAEALDRPEPFGVWGGMTERQRRRLLAHMERER